MEMHKLPIFVMKKILSAWCYIYNSFEHEILNENNEINNTYPKKNEKKSFKIKKRYFIYIEFETNPLTNSSTLTQQEREREKKNFKQIQPKRSDWFTSFGICPTSRYRSLPSIYLSISPLKSTNRSPSRWRKPGQPDKERKRERERKK